jgi:hypothetical protein
MSYASRKVIFPGALYFELTLLLGEMSNVARYGQYGDKFHLVFQSWYI